MKDEKTFVLRKDGNGKQVIAYDFMITGDYYHLIAHGEDIDGSDAFLEIRIHDEDIGVHRVIEFLRHVFGTLGVPDILYLPDKCICEVEGFALFLSKNIVEAKIIPAIYKQKLEKFIERKFKGPDWKKAYCGLYDHIAKKIDEFKVPPPHYLITLRDIMFQVRNTLDPTLKPHHGGE